MRKHESGRCQSVHGLLIAAVMMLAPTAQAADTDALRFGVSKGVSALVRLLGDGTLEVGIDGGSGRQVLPAATDEEGGGTRLGHADFNFDGHQDLYTSATVGQVNESTLVYLYEPATRKFRALEAPAGPELSCEGLWGLSPDPATRTLTSSCRSGPMWYSDIYRFDGDRLYLFRSMRDALIQTDTVAQLLSLDAADEAGVLVVWSSWDATGKRVDQAMWNAFDPPLDDAPMRGQGAVVIPDRLPLYRHAGDDSTARYLIKGDHVELLDQADGWLQLRYHNPRRGPVLGWVKLPEPG